MNGYFPNGPTVWRVSYNYKFEQFDDLTKAINYIKNNLTNGKKHMLTIRKVNLKEVKQFTPEFEQEVNDLGR